MLFVKGKFISDELLFTFWPLISSNVKIFCTNVIKTVLRITAPMTVFVKVFANFMSLTVTKFCETLPNFVCGGRGFLVVWGEIFPWPALTTGDSKGPVASTVSSSV
jgi:hypothetical protein